MADPEQLQMLEQQEQHIRAMLASPEIASSYEQMARLFAELRHTRRRLFLARGEETVVPIPWEPLWDACSPAQQVIASATRLFLLYRVPLGDGDVLPPAVIVEFADYECFRECAFRNDTVESHPYRGRGLELHAAHMVANSLWIGREQNINATPPRHEDASWNDYRHYVLTFPDAFFECLARRHRVTVFKGGLKEAMERVIAVLEAETEEE